MCLKCFHFKTIFSVVFTCSIYIYFPHSFRIFFIFVTLDINLSWFLFGLSTLIENSLHETGLNWIRIRWTFFTTFKNYDIFFFICCSTLTLYRFFLKSYSTYLKRVKDFQATLAIRNPIQFFLNKRCSTFLSCHLYICRQPRENSQKGNEIWFLSRRSCHFILFCFCSQLNFSYFNYITKEIKNHLLKHFERLSMNIVIWCILPRKCRLYINCNCVAAMNLKSSGRAVVVLLSTLAAETATIIIVTKYLPVSFSFYFTTTNE